LKSKQVVYFKSYRLYLKSDIADVLKIYSYPTAFFSFFSDFNTFFPYYEKKWNITVSILKDVLPVTLNNKGDNLFESIIYEYIGKPRNLLFTV